MRRHPMAALLAAATGVLFAAGCASTTADSAVANGPSAPVRHDLLRHDLSVTAQSEHPHRDAIHKAQTLIARATVLPGAKRVERKPVAALDAGAVIDAATHHTVWRHAFWTAPGTVKAALHYFTAHPPERMKREGSSMSGGGNRPTVQGLTFGEDTWRPYNVHWWGDYTVTAYHGGVAVAAYAEVVWAPYRSPSDLVPSSATSVDVTVVTPPHQGDPTVHKKLTGDAARVLVDAVNRLPRTNPVGPIPCPLGGSLFDTLVFHSPGRTAQVKVDFAGCASTTFRAGNRKPILLADPYGLHTTIITALGLPKNYGH